MSDQGERAPEGAPANGSTSRTRRVIAVITVAVVAVGAAVGWYWSANGGFPGSTPTPTIDPVATYLSQPEDLQGVREGVTWTVATTATTMDAATPQPKCFLPASEMEVTPADSMVRTFTPNEDTAAGVLHQVERYATAEEAQQAYAARLAQLATCERTVALALEGVGVAGLADESTAQKLLLQNAENEYHTVLLTRTGTRVNVLDVTTTDTAIYGGPLAEALRAVSARQCTDGGTCPGELVVTPSAPNPAPPTGWLTSIDLPRITPAAGTWRGTDVTPAVTTTGTRCEGIDLAAAGADRQQRTYLLRDDAAAPAEFGVDEVVYTFGSPEESREFLSTLAGNLDGCASRMNTAQVTPTADLSSRNAPEASGHAWGVTQKTDQAAGAAHYRVSVVVSGNKATYLMANPSAEFDFTDEAWKSVGVRTLERLSQAS